MQFSIVIPFRNESANLPELYNHMKNFIDERNEDIEVLFINDASEDDGLEILQKCISKNKTFKLFRSKKRWANWGV